MNKKFLYVFTTILVIGMVFLLNIEVTTRQGVNYQWQTVKIPLYLKILNFYDRHFNYQDLAKKLTKDLESEEQRVLKLFAWTQTNIRSVPEGFPIIDDHVWHIIVRGYGACDQAQDVFTTLCNYAGVDAFFDFVYTKDQAQMRTLSFVRLNKKWRVFDPYNGVYFKNKHGAFASIEQIKQGDWALVNTTKIEKQKSDYAAYLENLSAIKNIGFKRANIQSPLRRIMFELRKWIRL